MHQPFLVQTPNTRFMKRCVETRYTIAYRSFHKTFPTRPPTSAGGLKHGASRTRSHARVSTRLSIFRRDNGSSKVCRAKIQHSTSRNVGNFPPNSRPAQKLRSAFNFLPSFFPLSLSFFLFLFPLYHFRDNRNENLHRFSAPLDFIFTTNSSNFKWEDKFLVFRLGKYCYSCEWNVFFVIINIVRLSQWRTFLKLLNISMFLLFLLFCE